MGEQAYFGSNLQPSGRRAHRRVRLSLHGTLETVSLRQAAMVTSLSCAGAGVVVEEAPLVGSLTILRVGPSEAFGEVVWSARGRCGIKFDERIPETTVIALRTLSDREPEALRAQRLADAKAWAEGRRA